MKSDQRCVEFDYLRLIGLLAIVIAHADPPAWLAQARNFGTPMLIVASGLTYGSLYRLRPMHARSFFKARFARLAVPLWSFLSVFFASAACIAMVTSKPFPFSIRDVLLSYGGQAGIPFVWIFGTYAVLAAATPLAIWSAKAPLGDRVFLLWLATIFAIIEWIAADCSHVLADLGPYLCLYFLAIRVQQPSNAVVLGFSVACLALFFALASYGVQLTGVFVPTQEFKYPPGIYYLAYGVGMVGIALVICRRLASHRSPAPVVWISSHSMWIYLWHIAAIFSWTQMQGLVKPFGTVVVAKLAFLLGTGVGAAYVQSLLVRRLFAGDSRTSRFMTRHFG